MPFTYGTKWKCTGYTAYPYVGISTKLAPEGSSIDLTGATAITFRLRSHVNDLTVYFIVETMDIIRDSSFAYFYSAVVTTKGRWTDCEVPLPAGITQPSWANGDMVKDTFARTMCAKFTWKVDGESNTLVKSDTLDIDDIVIKGYTYVYPSAWHKVETGRPEKGLFSSFEPLPKNLTPLGTSWYAYDDHADSGNSLIARGAAVDRKNGVFPLDFSETNTGFQGSGGGAAVRMQFGKAFGQVGKTGDTTIVPGFTGIGFFTYDSAGALYFNPAAGKLGDKGGAGSADGIYFEYLAEGNFKYLTLEVKDWNDVPDKNDPQRRDKRGKGIAWHRDLPKTGTVNWRRVWIPFDSLTLHEGWKDCTPIPLDKTRLAAVQFRVEGPEGKTGLVMIDNVYFPGIDFPSVTSVERQIAPAGRQSVFRAYYRNGMIRLHGEPPGDFTGKYLSVVNSKGAVVQTCALAPGRRGTPGIPAIRIPAGLYFARVTGIDAHGKRLSRQVPFMISK
jgi:hypothetical protein